MISKESAGAGPVASKDETFFLSLWTNDGQTDQLTNLGHAESSKGAVAPKHEFLSCYGPVDKIYNYDSVLKRVWPN